MTASPTYVDDELAVSGTLRRITILFRLLGWVWLMILAALTLPGDPEASAPVVIATMCLATGWTALTVWMARPSNPLGASWFVIADFVVALAVGAASTIAGAEDLFHGGYPMSTLAVAAYGFGMRGAVTTSLILTAEQAVTHQIDERGLIPAVGSIVFIFVAVILGWAFDNLRAQERRLLQARDELDEAHRAESRQRERVLRQKERLDLANRLHDTVLQTLGVLRRDAEDPQQVRYLARRQERQLRRTISEYRSSYSHSARAALQGICDEIEDVYRIEIDAVIRGDADMEHCCEAVLAAAREALVNSAKHSGVDKVDLYAELDTDRTRIHVKDRGLGFDPATSATGRGLDHGLRQRVHDVGGAVTISSPPEGGTEVAISWEAT
jgi:signal transduction histidine kinase